MFTPEEPYGIDILDNLPIKSNPWITNVLFDNERIIVTPNYYGLWYRDDLAVGLEEKEEHAPATYSQLSVYPNPSSDLINIHCEKNTEFDEYQVIDYSGKLIMNGKIETCLDNFSLDVSNLSVGIYLIMIRGNDQINSGKFIKAD